MDEKTATDHGIRLSPRAGRVARYAALAVIGAVVLGGGFLAYRAVQPPAPTDLVPHRAMYDVTLTRLASGGNLTDISGLMIYEWGRDCGAWKTNSRATLRYVYSDGDASTVNSEQSSRETLDGQRMDFATRREEGDHKVTEVRGTAYAGKVVEFQKPAGKKLDLPAGAYFPMGHTRKILELARAGVAQFSAPLFDGTDADGAVSLVNAIYQGAVRPPVAANAHIAPGLLTDTARRFRFAFFKPDGQDATPEYEMQVDAQDNGVVRSIEIQYDDFTVKQTLKALDPLPVPKCALSRGGRP